MYKLLLILRYVRRKIAPLFAMLAVALCTAMVIIVISVMGGFLALMTESAHALEGDITISSGMRGFPHYEQLMDELRTLKEVEAATAVITNFGMINFSSKDATRYLPNYITYVQIFGIDADEFDKVISYRDRMYWTSQRTSKYLGGTDLTDAGMTFRPPNSDTTGDDLPGIVLGIELGPYNRRDAQGQYDFGQSIIGNEHLSVTLTAVRFSNRGSPTPLTRPVVAVNEYKSGLYEVDKMRVFVDFDFLQKLLNMDRFEKIADDGSTLVDPGRANEIVVKSRADVTLDVLERVVEEKVAAFELRHHNDADFSPLTATTWKKRHATFLGAVEKEKIMLTTLFAIISLVAVVMIGVVFYMIVLEKTHDIGVLRAMGASRSGIASVFLGYGTAIGIIGAAIGLALSAAIVFNINAIQAWLTKQFGFTMWDPEIYFFDKIPARLDPTEVTVILTMAIVSGLLGAVVPAVLASRLKPVEALRYE